MFWPRPFTDLKIRPFERSTKSDSHVWASPYGVGWSGHGTYELGLRSSVSNEIAVHLCRNRRRPAARSTHPEASNETASNVCPRVSFPVNASDVGCRAKGTSSKSVEPRTSTVDVRVSPLARTSIVTGPRGTLSSV